MLYYSYVSLGMIDSYLIDIIVVFLAIRFLLVYSKQKTDNRGFFGFFRDKKAPELKEKPFNGVYFGHAIYPIGKPIAEDGHILVIGGAGSGKSSCIAIPTLKYFWDGRFLAVDIKGELAKKSGRKAHIFNPTDKNAQGFDPFYLLKQTSDNPISHVRDIALAIIPTIPDARDPFWVQASQDILTGHLLFNYKNGASFVEAVNYLQSVPSEVLIEIDSEDEECSKYSTPIQVVDFLNTISIFQN